MRTPRTMFLITGATGQVGGEAARVLLAVGATVRVLVRDPAGLEGLAGADIVLGTFEHEQALAEAMYGIDVMLLSGRDNPDQVKQHERVLRRASKSGVGHVVKLSAIGASTTSPIELMRHHGILEQRLSGGPMRWTVVRPHLFLQNLLRAALAVRTTGRLRAPMGDVRVPFVDTRDVGSAVAAILASADRHVRRTYTLTGPARVSYGDIAAAMSRVAGRPVVYDAVSPEQRKRELIAAGLAEWRAHDLSHIASAYTQQQWAVTPDLAQLLGRRPRSLEDFLNDHAAHFAATAL